MISNGQVGSDCAIIVLIATDVPFHVFKTENFVPTDDKLVVTASDPDRRIVREFNAGKAAEEYAAAVGHRATGHVNADELRVAPGRGAGRRRILSAGRSRR